MTISNAFTKTFGQNYKNYKGDIGLEIETESKDDYKIPKFSFWDVHQDGSLRDIGREFVLKQPLDFDTTFPQALEEFKDKTKGIDFVQNSITTSVHVHLNFLNDNFVTLGNFLASYAFVENILIRYSGDDRLSNLFCLPICDAEETYHNILRMVEALPKKKYGHLQFDLDHTKYGALNLSSLVRFGSLEIRSFRGTTDTDVIKTWVGVLYSILKYARQPKLTPPDIIKTYKEKGSEILSDIFGEYRKLIRHKDENSLLDQNLWYAVNIACGSVKDWSKLEEVPRVTKPNIEDLDKLSNDVFGHSFEELSFEQQKNILQRMGEKILEEPPRGVYFAPADIVAAETGIIERPRRGGPVNPAPALANPILIVRAGGVGEMTYTIPAGHTGEGQLYVLNEGERLMYRHDNGYWVENDPTYVFGTEDIEDDPEEADNLIPEWEDDEAEPEQDNF